MYCHDFTSPHLGKWRKWRKWRTIYIMYKYFFCFSILLFRFFIKFFSHTKIYASFASFASIQYKKYTVILLFRFFIKFFSHTKIYASFASFASIQYKKYTVSKVTQKMCYFAMSCFLEKLPNFFGKSLHIFWTLYTSDNDHSVKWCIFCTKQMLCCWWDFVKFPCRVSMIVTTPQPWYWA